MFNDCRRCDTRGAACQDCVVAVIAPLNGARHLEAEELRALSVLADAGMVPPLRLHTKAGLRERADERQQAEPATLPEPRSWAYPATRAS
jgi:hypothetical protein